MYDIAMRLKNDYRNIPWYISENGMGVSEEGRFMDEEGVVQDTYRIEFLENHLTKLSEAIKDGSNCFGYHMWTFSDCWSWLNAYKNRYGFYRVNREDGYKRSDKLSSYWFKSVIENGGFEKTDDSSN